MGGPGFSNRCAARVRNAFTTLPAATTDNHKQAKRNSTPLLRRAMAPYQEIPATTSQTAAFLSKPADSSRRYSGFTASEEAWTRSQRWSGGQTNAAGDSTRKR